MKLKVTLKDNNVKGDELVLDFDTENPPVFLANIPKGDPRLEDEVFCAAAFRDFYNSILDPHPSNVTKRVEKVEKLPSPPKDGVQVK